MTDPFEDPDWFTNHLEAIKNGPAPEPRVTVFPQWAIDMFGHDILDRESRRYGFNGCTTYDTYHISGWQRRTERLRHLKGSLQRRLKHPADQPHD